MALEITLRPALLTYTDTILLLGQVLQLEVSYRVRDNDWWISILDGTGRAIVRGLRAVTGRPLTLGLFDPSLPLGQLFVVRLDDTYRDAGAGELGDVARLLFLTPQEAQEMSFAPDTGYVRLKSVGAG